MPQDVRVEIANIIKGINSSTNADKIYLFGSYAYGNPNDDSDIDDECIELLAYGVQVRYPYELEVNIKDMKTAIVCAERIQKLIEDKLKEF